MTTLNPDPDPPRRTAPRGAALPPACEIVLQNPRRYPEAAARLLRPWLSSLVTDLAPGAASFCVRFVSDREMRRWNRGYRGKDQTTDVLSFPMDELRPGTEDMPTPAGLLGDIVLCPQVAETQAVAAKHSTMDELVMLTTHGLLHLLGFDHAEPEEEREMFGLQRELITAFQAVERRRNRA